VYLCVWVRHVMRQCNISDFELRTSDRREEFASFVGLYTRLHNGVKIARFLRATQTREPEVQCDAVTARRASSTLMQGGSSACSGLPVSIILTLPSPKGLIGCQIRFWVLAGSVGGWWVLGENLSR
jgi:hypothetical protein